MELRKIKTEVCPHCKSEAVLDERYNYGPHKNDFTESREFECGFNLLSKSDSNTTVVHKPCPNSEEYKTMSSKRVKALENLYGFIDELDVDDEFKCDIRAALMRELSVDE